MSETFDPTAQSAAESATTAASAFGTQTKEKLLTQAKKEPAKTFLIVLTGSMLTGLLVGYCIARAEAESRRQRLIEDWMREVTDWIREHGSKVVKGGVEATKSAIEEVSRSGERARGHLQPFFEKQKRSVLNLF